MKKQPKTYRGQMRRLTSGKGNMNPETPFKKERKKIMKSLKKEVNTKVDVC